MPTTAADERRCGARLVRLGAAQRCAALHVIAAALVALWLMCGCDAKKTSTDGGEADAQRASPTKVSEADLDKLQEEAIAALLRPSAPVPPPAPRELPPPQDGPLRLAQLLPRAEVACTWTPPAGGDVPVAQVGRISLSEPGERGRSGVQRLGAAGNMLALQTAGLSVPCAEVGQVEIIGQFGVAQNVQFAWSAQGSFEFIIARPGETATLTFSTAGLGDWEGTVNEILLRVPEAEGNTIEIESIRFLRPVSAFREPAGTASATLDYVLRRVVYGHCPATIRLPEVEVPAGAMFDCGLGVIGGAGAVTYRLLLETEQGTREVFAQTVEPSARWTDVKVALDGAAGLRGTLVLEMDGPPGAVATWAEPEIYVPQASPPRVLVYLIDTLAAKHMSLYGCARPTTPTLDALAQRGAWFAHAFANATRTVESIPNLMLSLHTASHGVDNLYATASSAFVTLAEEFGRAGFSTACFSTNVNAGPRQNMDQGFGAFYDHIAFYWSQDSTRTVPIEQVAGWMERHRDRPVFVYVHTAEPHAPYQPPPPFDTQFDPDYLGTIDGTYDKATGFMRATLPRDVEHVVALYQGEVAFADHMYGRFMERLGQLGLDENLTTVVTADHGEQFLEHGHWMHGADVHGELSRVPLIVHAADARLRSGRIDAPVQLLDVMPTLLELYGISASVPLQGDSVAGLLRGERPAAATSRLIFTSTYQPTPPQHGVLRWPWRLIYTGRRLGERPFVLFHVEQDPGETRDRLAEEPHVAAELLCEMVRWRTNLPRFADSGEAQHRQSVDEEQLRQLREMGYIQ